MLIMATVAGPVLATLAAPGFIAAVLKLARARARRVKYVNVSGADLYSSGVPMTETQFREVFAAYQAALKELLPEPRRPRPGLAVVCREQPVRRRRSAV